MADLDDDIHWELEPKLKAKAIAGGFNAPKKANKNGHLESSTPSQIVAMTSPHLDYQPTGEWIQPPTIPITWFQHVKPAVDTHDFVEDLLGDGQLSVVYGESNCGKTFWALDLALSIARGGEWFGREVDRRGVVYVALEGSYGIRNRIAAYKLHHGLEDATLPFGIVQQSLDLLETTDGPRLTEAIGLASKSIEMPVGLVVLDTLSRAMAGGNENSPEDMGGLVRNVDLIRAATGSHVMFIHHSGKDQARGARGHSLLRAATDTEIEISRPEGSKISCAAVKKQRELSTDGAFSFSLRAVEVGVNHRQKAITSCVVEPAGDAEADEVKRAKRLPNKQQIVLAALRSAIESHGEHIPPSSTVPAGVQGVPEALWRKYYYQRSVAETEEGKRKAFKRGVEYLQGNQIIGISNDMAWIY